MTTTYTTIHPDANAPLRITLVDLRSNTFTTPYYGLTVEGVTTYVSPTQLTQLADTLAQYRTTQST